MSTAAVGQEDDDAGEQGEAGHGEDELLGPAVGALGPGGHAAVVGQGSRGVEDGEAGGHHGKDDEGAAEVDATQSELGHADTGFDFLQELSVISS